MSLTFRYFARYSEGFVRYRKHSSWLSVTEVYFLMLKKYIKSYIYIYDRKKTDMYVRK